MQRDISTIDKNHLWHPFTQMADWCAPDHSPLIIESGQGAILRDSLGRDYIDGNSSIWTNIHGHNHPAINNAITEQLGKIAHSSFLGFTNEPAVLLAEALVKVSPGDLNRVFYSDDGSTAVECAMKMAIQFWQQSGESERCEFIAFDNAYHGDTLGAATLGGIAGFHERFSSFGVTTHHVQSADDLHNLPDEITNRIAAVAIEPLIQGAAGMQPWPEGMLRDVRTWCDQHGTLLILDEVMTGFGRTGTLFACEQEDVTPDFLALAKGLTGGYMPLAATLTTERVFSAFLGDVDKTFYYGHSYCGNQMACAAALANLDLFEREQTLANLQPKIALLSELLEELRTSTPQISDIRRCGFIAGIDVRGEADAGKKVCLAAREFGLLTRPIRNTIVLMLPLCSTDAEIRQAVGAIEKAIPSAEG